MIFFNLKVLLNFKVYSFKSSFKSLHLISKTCSSFEYVYYRFQRADITNHYAVNLILIKCFLICKIVFYLINIVGVIFIEVKIFDESSNNWLSFFFEIIIASLQVSN